MKLIRREAPTGMPLWVLIVSVVAGVVLMIAVILILHKVRINHCLLYHLFAFPLLRRDRSAAVVALWALNRRQIWATN